ncbi:MAG: hypothetical protein U9R74_13180 [Pseudomonadota bacterium]|nr:hypothetical protein [Pseudomonadota bacterium]
MADRETSERNEALRKAIEWIVAQDGPKKSGIEAAARLFDLSPRDEEFLVRYFSDD